MKGDTVDKHMQDGCVQLQGRIELWIAPMEEKILGMLFALVGHGQSEKKKQMLKYSRN